MLLLTIFDLDAEKCGPVFTAENENVAKRLVFSQYEKMPSYVADRMEIFILGNLDVKACELQYISGSTSLGTISSVQELFSGTKNAD